MVKVRNAGHAILTSIRRFFLRNFYHMNISKTARIAIGAFLDKTNPKDIYIGDESYVSSGAMIFTHDYSRSIYKKTIIGKKCFIGAKAIILPGVNIGDSVIVGTGSVVT